MQFVFLIITALVALGGYYIHQGLAHLAPHWVWLRWGVSVANALGIASMLVGFLLRDALPTSLLRVLVVYGTSWLFVFLYTLMAMLLFTALRLIPQLRPHLVDSYGVTIVLVLGIVSVFIYGNWRYHTKERVELDVKIDKPLSQSLKVVALSDMHLGYTIGRGEVARWVDMINQERADLILIAGDVVDGDTRPVLEAGMQQELSRLKARLGVYAVLGNHEYIGDEAHEGKVLSQTSIKLLRDEAVLVDNALYIVGRDDRMNPNRAPLAHLIEGLDSTKPIVVLDHQPYELGESARLGVDFQLSGHTHRGQVFPVNLVVDRMYEQAHGYLRKGNSHFYVSSGLGIWGGKFRIGTQSEYAVITLHGS